MIDPNHPKSLEEVLEEGTKGDNPKSVVSYEDFPQTISKFKLISKIC